MKTIDYEKALHQLAAYCIKAEKCIFDLRKKMIRWNIPEHEQEKILRKLQQGQFLDESRFCRAFVNDKIKYNQWGIYKIKYELKRKNIPDSIVRSALSDIDSFESQKQLRVLLSNKQKHIKGNNEYEIKQKLIRFAAGRGFPIEDIEKALSSL